MGAAASPETVKPAAKQAAAKAKAGKGGRTGHRLTITGPVAEARGKGKENNNGMPLTRPKGAETTGTGARVKQDNTTVVRRLTGARAVVQPLYESLRRHTRKSCTHRGTEEELTRRVPR